MSLSGASIASPINAGDAPALLFHGTADPLVPYQWAVNTVNAARGGPPRRVPRDLDRAPATFPYVQFRDQILTQTRNFLWWEMNLAQAAH